MELCKHALEGKCALGKLCKFQHLRDTSDEDFVVVNNDAEDSAVPTEREIIRWFWKELTSHYTVHPNQWKAFSQEWEKTLEELWAATEGHGEAVVKGAYRVNFELMSLSNVHDGGSRRPIQRVRCAAMPQWFLVDKEKAISCGVEVSRLIEQEYLLGARSILCLSVVDRHPLRINFNTMLGKDPVGQRTVRLSRQIVVLSHASAAGNPYNVPALDQRPTFLSVGGDQLYCVEGTVSSLKHRGLLPVDEPAYLDTEQAFFPPSGPCLNQDCQNSHVTHISQLTHSCVWGKRALCFLCETEETLYGDAYKARREAHCRCFTHGLSKRPLDALQLWKGRQNVSREFHRMWDKQIEAIDLRNVHVGAAEGMNLLSQLGDSTILKRFPRIQRVQHVHFYARYLRTRNELVDLLMTRPSGSELASQAKEEVLFALLPRGSVLDVLERGLERIVFYRSAVEALKHDADRTLVQETSQIEISSFSRICRARLAHQFASIGDEAVDDLLLVAVGCAPSVFRMPDSDLLSKATAPVVPEWQPSDLRECAMFDGACNIEETRLSLYDSCQWCPMYLILIRKTDINSEAKLENQESGLSNPPSTSPTVPGLSGV